MNKFLFLFMLIMLPLFGQEDKSLLWEISGNGLEKSSYLYGTMHVSKKIAFRLDDVFYKALDASDIVALESDPATWLDMDLDAMFMNFGYGSNMVEKGFYINAFKIDNPSKKMMSHYLAFEDQFINNILYRTTEYSQNFEEETYLDMFIYQAGKKFDKPVVALEDGMESLALVTKASFDATKEDPDQWLQKKLYSQDYIELLQDAYRERNIDLMDSINKGMYTENYMKNMLYLRNHNMANALDSVMPRGKVFAGIGAAHLPGKEGVIHLLRKKGYTVKALTSKSSYSGAALKNKFEKTVKPNSYEQQFVTDSLFSLALPNKLYSHSLFGESSYISPDLTNGSFVVINRLNNFNFLKPKDALSMDDVDELLFENIPGDILDKKMITIGGFKALDIKNVLKNGDHQRYHIIYTPLEIIMIKMGGKGDYVKQYADQVFESIAFKPIKHKSLTQALPNDPHTITLPDFHKIDNAPEKKGFFARGFDSISNTTYFIKKVALNDVSYIEKDSFELRQIQKRFYQQLELEPVYNTIESASLTSSAAINTENPQQLYLKTTIKENDFYLFGAIASNKSQASKFFNSFKAKTSTTPIVYQQIVDTALFFKTKSSVKPPFYAQNSQQYGTKKDKKPYLSYSKSKNYVFDNGDAIYVSAYKTHDFSMYHNLDTVWNKTKDYYKKKGFNIAVTSKDEASDIKTLNYMLTDTASTRAVVVKNVIKGGVTYHLKTVIDTIKGASEEVATFYEHFTPFDSIIGKDVFLDKTDWFFNALRANDSIALSGYREIELGKRNIDSIKHCLTTINFDKEKWSIQKKLIQALIEHGGNKEQAFIKALYRASYTDAKIQMVILNALLKKPTDNTAEQLLDFMETDLPLAASYKETKDLFQPFLDSVVLSKKLFPEIMDYSTINEYKSPIFAMLSALKQKGLVKASFYKKYKNQMLNDAKIVLKRKLGVLNTKTGKNYSFRGGFKNTILEDYLVLLFPFRNDRNVADFIAKLRLLKDNAIETTYITLLIKSGEVVDQSLLKELANNVESRVLLFQKLEKMKQLQWFPAEFKTHEKIAEALVSNRIRATEKDSVIFIKQLPLQRDTDRFIGYYFKTIETNKGYDKNKMHLIVFEQDAPLSVQPFYRNNGLVFEDYEEVEDVITYVTEAFLLKKHLRAKVYRRDEQEFDLFSTYF